MFVQLRRVRGLLGARCRRGRRCRRRVDRDGTVEDHVGLVELGDQGGEGGVEVEDGIDLDLVVAFVVPGAHRIHRALAAVSATRFTNSTLWVKIISASLSSVATW